MSIFRVKYSVGVSFLSDKGPDEVRRIVLAIRDALLSNTITIIKSAEPTAYDIWVAYDKTVSEEHFTKGEMVNSVKLNEKEEE